MRKLILRAGPPRGCDATLRPRGRAAGGPREEQVAHRARTRGSRPSGSTRVHADARVGCHMAGGLAFGGPTGLVGPGESIGVVTQRRYRGALFNRKSFAFFLRVALSSHEV